MANLKAENSKHHDQIITLTDKAAEVKKEIDNLTGRQVSPEPINFESDPEYVRIKGEISSLEAEVYTAPDSSELKEKKASLQAKITGINNQLSLKSIAESSRARIDELEKELRSKSQELAGLEKQEFIMTDFEKTKMDLIEGKVNKMFSMVQFKLFSQLINGGSEPTCETLIDGVPWSDANNAGRINGGLDIINTLCNYYQVSAPIFVDNSESINRLIPVTSQIIRLIVSHDPKLVFSQEKQLAESSI
jgi:hypothetical protein